MKISLIMSAVSGGTEHSSSNGSSCVLPLEHAVLREKGKPGTRRVLVLDGGGKELAQ